MSETKSLTVYLNLLSPAMHSQNFVPVLTHFCFTKDLVYAYDDRTAIVCAHGSDFECAIPGRALLDLLDGASDGFTLEQKGAEAVLTDKGSIMRLPTLSKSDFVFEVPKDKPIASYALTEALVRALETAAANANREAIRPNLMGVTLVADTRRLLMYGTDNVTLTRVTAPAKRGGDVSAILARESCDLIVKTWNDLREANVRATFSIGKHTALVEYEAEEYPPIALYAKLIQAEPQDFERTLVDHSKGAEYVDVNDELRKAVRRANVVNGDEIEKRCTLEPQDNFIDVSAKGPLGELKARVRCKGVGAGDPYPVNPELLARALDHCSRIGFGGKSLTLANEEDGVETLILVAKVTEAK